MSDTVIVATTQSNSRSKDSSWQHWLTILGLYTGVAILITFPAILHLNDSLFGVDATGDNGWLAWLLWLFRHSLASGTNPAFTNSVYALDAPAQVFVPLLLKELVGAGLQFLFSPVATYNLLLLSTFVLSGFTMYVLLREFVSNPLAAFVGGFFYDFSAFHLMHGLGHLDLSSMECLPFWVWRVWLFYRQPTLKNSLWLAVGTLLVIFSSFYFTAYFLLPFGFLFFLAKLCTNWAWFTRKRNLLLAGLAIVLTLVIAVPPLYDSFFVNAEERQTIKETAIESSDYYTADLSFYFFPSPDNPYIGSITTNSKLFTEPEGYIFLGYVGIFLNIICFAFKANQRRLTYFWAGFGLFGIALSLGSILPGINFSLYKLFYGLPVFLSFRVPSRLGIIPLFATSVLVALALQQIFPRLRFKQAVFVKLNKFAPGLLAVLLMIIQLFTVSVTALPYPISAAPVPALYTQIASDPSDSLVLELPTYFKGSYEYYQIVHQKPLVDGYLSRVTNSMLNSVETIPYLSQINSYVPPTSEAQTLFSQGSSDIYPIDVDFAGALAEQHIKYVILHRQFFDGKLDQKAADYVRIRQFLITHLGQPFYNNGDEQVEAWTITAAPPPLPPHRIRLGAFGWEPGLTAIANKPARIVSQDGQLMVTSQQADSQLLSFEAQSVYVPLDLELRLNGVVVKEVHFAQPHQTQTIQVPITLKTGNNLIEFHSKQGCLSAHDLDSSDLHAACLSLAVQQIQLAAVN
jgi:hypothetical protein